LWRIVEHYVWRAVEKLDLSRVRRIAADETSARRGHDYISLFVDMARGKVVYVADARNVQNWHRCPLFRRHFPIHKLFERSCELGLWRLSADKIATIFGKRVSRRMHGKLATVIDGAGAIMKEGLNVRGLNTAATLWCSAAVGAAAGAGLVAFGMLGQQALNPVPRLLIDWAKDKRTLRVNRPMLVVVLNDWVTETKDT